MRYQILSRALPGYIAQVRYTGLSATGATVFGPRTFAKAAEITLSDVPVETATIRMEYLQNGVVRGLGLVSVTLRTGATFLIDDPPFQDVQAVLLSLLISPEAIRLPAGVPLSLTATGQLNTGEAQDFTRSVEWLSADPDIVVVSSTGQLEGVAPGQTVVTAKLGNVQATRAVLITEAELEQLVVEPGTLNLPKGATGSLAVDGVFTDGSRHPLMAGLSWTIEDRSIAEVDSEGVVEALRVGQTTIRVQNEEGLHATAIVNVTAAVVKELHVVPATHSLPKGVSVQLRAIATFTDRSELDVTDQASWSSGETSIVTVTNSIPRGQATARSKGTTTVDCFYDDLQASVELTVTPEVLVAIELETEPSSLPIGLSTKIIAMGRYSDNSRRELSNLAWSSENEEIAAISSVGRVTGLSQGTTTVRASHLGLTGSLSLMVSDRRLTELVINEETRAQMSLPVGLSQQLSVTGRFSDGSMMNLSDQVYWSTRDATIATVSATGEWSARTPGRTRVRVYSPVGVSAEANAVVEAARVEELQIVPQPEPLPIGVRVPIKTEGLMSDGSVRDVSFNVSYSTNREVGEFELGDRRNYLRTKSSGDLVVTAKLYNGQSYLQTSLTISVENLALEQVMIDPAELSIPAGLEHRFHATGRYANGANFNLDHAVTWSYTGSGGAIAVHGPQDGDFEAKSAGSGTVRASHPDGLAGTALVTVVGGATVRDVIISPRSLSIPKGGYGYPSAVVEFSNGYLLTLNNSGGWSSSDKRIVAPSSDGRLSGIELGTADVTVTYRGVSDTIPVEVSDAKLVSFQFDRERLRLPSGLRNQLVCLGTFSDKSVRDVTAQLTWESDDPRVASVSNESGSRGLVTTLEEGPVLLTAIHPELGLKQSISLEVTRARLVSVSIDDGPTYLQLDTDRKFKAEGTYSDGKVYDLTQAVEWSSSDPGVATVGTSSSERGYLTGVGLGETQITAHEPVSGVSGNETIRIVSGTKVREAMVTDDAIHLQCSPDGQRLYLLSRTALQTFRTSDLQILDTQSFTNASGMDVSPDGSFVLVSHWDLDRLTRISQSDFTTTSLALPAGSPARGVTIGDNGYAYATSSGVVAIELSSGALSVGSLTGYFGGGHFIRFDAANSKVVVANSGTSPSKAYRLGVDGAYLTYEDYVETGGNGRSLELQPGGGRFVFCVGGGNGPGYTIFLYNLFHLTEPVAVMDPGTYPREAAFSPDGSILYAVNGDFYDRRIYIFDAETGRELGHIVPENPETETNLNGLEVSADGTELYLYTWRSRSPSASKVTVYRLR